MREFKGKSIINNLKNYVVLDLETTGLDPCYDEIIEIGIARVRDNQIVDTFNSFVKPNDEIDEFITNLTGITNDMVKDAPKIEEILDDVIDFIENDVIVGHNISFDINFLYDNLIDNNKKPLVNDYMDTMRLSRKLLPELKHHRLKDLAQYYNVDLENSHRALGDVKITFEILNHMYDDIILKYKDFGDFEKMFAHKTQIKSKDITTNEIVFDNSNYLYEKLLL